VTDAAAIAAYSVFVVPSSQGATYTQLQDATVQSSLRSVLKGRVVAWSGTPDVSPDAAGNKARVIRNLADWAKSASGKLPGVVVLLDLSTDATRYGWLQGIADVSLTPYATSALGPAWSFNNIAWKTAAPGNSIADAIKAGVTTDYGTAVQVGFSTATVSPGIVAAEATPTTGAQSDRVTRPVLVGFDRVPPANTQDQATLTVTGMPAVAQAFGATFTVSTSGGSGTGAVTFAATGACSVGATGADGSALVTINASTGTCSITATKAASTGFNSATSAPATVGVTTATQSALTVTGMPATAQAFGATFTVSTSGGSGTGAVTFAAAAGGACTVNATSGLVEITSGNGTCSVTVTKAADGSYSSTTSAPATVAAKKATATIDLSGLTHTYDGSVKSATVTPKVGTVVTPLSTVSVTYDGAATAPTNYKQGGYAVVASLDNANYEATPAQGTLTISAAPTTLVASVNPSTIGYGGSVTLSATLTSNNTSLPNKAVEFKIGTQVIGTATTSSPATLPVDLSQFTALSASTTPYTVTATFSGGGNYADATDATKTLTITKANQAAVAVTGMPNTAQAFGAEFTVGASGGTGTGAYSFASDGACSVIATSGLVKITSGTGTCSITANRAATATTTSARSRQRRR
jgi:hypothetical protein